jgi:ribonuclease P protein component
MGGAVARNRAKRRVRELFRTGVVPAGRDLVVVPRRELVEADWGALAQEFRMLLRRGNAASGRSA